MTRGEARLTRLLSECAKERADLEAENDHLRKALERIRDRNVRARTPEGRAWDYEQVAAHALSPDTEPSVPAEEEERKLPCVHPEHTGPCQPSFDVCVAV